jgi:hypothetical protein
MCRVRWVLAGLYTGTLEPLRNLRGLVSVDIAANNIGGTSSRMFDRSRWW